MVVSPASDGRCEIIAVVCSCITSVKLIAVECVFKELRFQLSVIRNPVPQASSWNRHIFWRIPSSCISVSFPRRPPLFICTSSIRNTVSLLLTQSTLQSWTFHMFWGLLLFICTSSCRLPGKLLVTHLPRVLKTSVTQSHFVQSSSSQDPVVT